MELTLSDIAQLTEGTIINGQPDQSFNGLAALKDATAQDVSFLGNSKYESQFHESKAGAVLISPETKPPLSSTTALVQVTNPTLAFSAIIEALHQKSAPPFTPGIHPTAYIGEHVQIDPKQVQIGPHVVIGDHSQIGNGTRINASSVIDSHVIIGDNCHLHSNTSIREYCILGNHVIIQPGAVIGSDGYGYEMNGGKHLKIPQVGIVSIEDEVEIGANTTIDRARFGETIIGQGTKIDNLVQIGHNAIIGKHCLIIAQSGIAGSTTIGDYVVIAAQCGIAGHLEIGDQAILGARTGVTKSIEGGKTYWGLPAKPIIAEQRIIATLNRLPSLIPELKKQLKAEIK